MKRYFYFIGVLELLGFVAGFVLQLIKLCLYFNQLSGFDIATNIIVMIVLLIVGPALGLLFISHANMMDESEYFSNKVKEYNVEKKTNQIEGEKFSNESVSDEKISSGSKVVFIKDYNSFKSGDIYTVNCIQTLKFSKYAYLQDKDDKVIGFAPFSVLKAIK